MEGQDTVISTKPTINCRGHLIPLDPPVVMGILNLTPDSFFDGGRYDSVPAALEQAQKMIAEGAAILDLGAMSSRPGAQAVSESEEAERLLPVVEALVKEFPGVPLSVDTYRSAIARQSVAAGAAIINDISGGELDEHMFTTVAELGVPYVLMHMQGKPDTMQQQPEYEDVTREIIGSLAVRVRKLRSLGVADVVIDPGFGFGKTVAHNFQLLRELDQFALLGCPVLAGVSRKSMINRVAGTTPSTAGNATTAAHMLALQAGAQILRVHDVREAVEAIRIAEAAKIH